MTNNTRGLKSTLYGATGNNSDIYTVLLLKTY